MSTPRELPALARLGAFGMVLAVVLGLALLAGARLGPDPAAAEAHGAEHGSGSAAEHGSDHGEDHGADHGSAEAATGVPGGLQVSQDGYTLALDETAVGSGTRPVAFRILGADGEPVTAYDVEHEKELHLIAVRRDLTRFQHVHPERDAAGTWRTDLDLTAGTWRVFADFVPEGGDPLTLGADLAVAGGTAPDAPADVADRRTSTVDGLEVTLDGDLVGGSESALRLTVTRGGEPVALQPYLGARGHLVALREGDLAYLHVHPTEEGSATEPVGFAAEVPSAGRYRLYYDFRVDGVVRTASFVVTAERSAS